MTLTLTSTFILKYILKITKLHRHLEPDPSILLTLVRMRMPFGKYEGRLLCDLPVSYLEWFARKGFPKGKLGMLLQTMHEIKINGLGEILQPLKALENKERPKD